MDLVYMPEVFIYGSFRSPQYRDYELSWNKEYLHNRKSSQTQWQRYPTEQSEQVTKETCHLCRETKRRSLAAYIRSKSRSDSNQGIHEEEEEEEAAAAIVKEEDTVNGDKKAVNTERNKSAKTSRDAQERK
ncbi:uncharacterized protein LOC105192195 [Harpegnathos saltator]|uniref:uncharacterized protein LOC105192195 n=1 Tax=Harpegnathos saltator TaxID=610380 RepID=UPI00058BDA8F|nr:uncharacterized protein LOC105192195 [Harpegnathos saltator]